MEVASCQDHVLICPESDIQESEIYACKEALISAKRQVHFGACTQLTEAGNQGRRLSMIVRHPTDAYQLALIGCDLLTLAESGRWIERLIPIDDGSAFIIVAGI